MKKKSAKRSKPINKTAFILAQGDVSAAEVIKRGKKAGIKLTDRYVYSARSKARVQAAKGIKPGRRGRPRKDEMIDGVRTVGVRVLLKHQQNGHAKTEQQFASLVMELGLSRSESLLREIRNRSIF